MLHPLRYKLNKTWTLNDYSLPLSLNPPALSTSIPSYLPPSLSPSHSLSLRSSLICLYVTLYLSRFPYSFPLISARLHHSSSTFSPATRFFLPILSFSLRRTWIRSWLFAHIYTNVEAIYAIQSNCVIPAMLHWHCHSLTQTMQSVNWSWTLFA